MCNLTSPCQMAEHMKISQAEINELWTEYWKLRHETGKFWYLLLYQVLSTHRTSSEVYMETLANKLGMQVRST